MLDPFIEGTDLEGGSVSESLAVLSFLLMRLLGMEKPEDEYVVYIPARHRLLHWSSPYLLVRPTPRTHGIAGGWHIPSSLCHKCIGVSTVGLRLARILFLASCSRPRGLRIAPRCTK